MDRQQDRERIQGKMKKFTHTVSSRIYHCEHCGETIKPGEKLTISEGSFYREGHEPKPEQEKKR